MMFYNLAGSGESLETGIRRVETPSVDSYHQIKEVLVLSHPEGRRKRPTYFILRALTIIGNSSSKNRAPTLTCDRSALPVTS